MHWTDLLPFRAILPPIRLLVPLRLIPVPARAVVEVLRLLVEDGSAVAERLLMRQLLLLWLTVAVLPPFALERRVVRGDGLLPAVERVRRFLVLARSWRDIGKGTSEHVQKGRYR